MYFTKMKDFVNSLTSENWFYIEFSVLGFIGKSIVLNQIGLSSLSFLSKVGSCYVVRVGFEPLKSGWTSKS